MAQFNKTLHNQGGNVNEKMSDSDIKIFDLEAVNLTQVNMLKELEAENKKLKEGVRVPRVLSVVDINAITDFTAHRYALLDVWPDIIEHFTTKGET